MSGNFTLDQVGDGNHPILKQMINGDPAAQIGPAVQVSSPNAPSTAPSPEPFV